MSNKQKTISQFDIDRLINIPKTLITEGMDWKKKALFAKDPAWLYLHFVVYDEDKLAIPNFNVEMKYRPAIDSKLLAKMSFTAIYKAQRIFALDVGGNELIHCNPYWQDKSLQPQPILPKVIGSHFHIHHEKYHSETGYPIAKSSDEVQNDFIYYLNEFKHRFNIITTGDIPHPYNIKDKIL
ncbi:hypothetical protein [Mannheimia indoligenes]|uniref:hypothetical protein n=1 Tax=Mannheimia indoligenes TaxID=3103145 RepID=UPI002FE57421